MHIYSPLKVKIILNQITPTIVKKKNMPELHRIRIQTKGGNYLQTFYL